MKPTKNHFYCPGCQRPKMLFESKKEAVLFLKYNADAIEDETGKRPVRAYYCNHCCGWHLTSKPNSYGRIDLIKRYGPEVGQKIYNIICPLITKGSTITEGLSRKIKELRHILNYEVINSTRCKCLINELFDIFEVVMGAQLEDRKTLDSLFSKFSDLCNVFTNKKQQTAIA